MTPDMVQTDSGLVLTPHGRWQVLQGLARPVIRYQGDPDTRPISQHEFVVLVRLFHRLSLMLNAYFGDDLSTYYNDNSIKGQIAR